MKRLKKVAIAVVSLLFCISSLGMISTAKELDDTISDDPRILVLLSYSYDWESVPLQLDAIAETLNGYACVDYVFMDTKRQAYEEVKESVYDQIHSYEDADGGYDYMITVDDDALHFAVEYREDLFQKVPIVFEGINDEDFAKEAAEDPLITGIIESFPLEETIKLALDVNKNATKIVAIIDNSISGKGSAKQFLDCKKQYSSLDFSVIDTSILTEEEIQEQVRNLDDDTILIYMMMTSDIGEVYYSCSETIEFVCANASVPVYKADELGIGHGVLGGKVVSYSKMAAKAARIVMEVQNGADFSEYQVIQAETEYRMDKAKMDQYSIRKSAMPKGTIYVNDPDNFWKRNRQMIPPFLFVSTLAVTVIISAYVNRKRHIKYLALEREAKEGLEEVQSSMEAAIDGADITYFEYYPKEQKAIEYNGLNRFGTKSLMENYPDSWFELGITIPEDEQILRDAFDEAANENREVVCETRNHINGEILWFRYNFTPINNENHEQIKIACTAININDSKIVERTLKEEKEHLRSIINKLPVGIYVCEMDGEHFTMVLANPAFCKIMGKKHEEIVGKSDEETLKFVHPDDREIMRNAAKKMSVTDGKVDYEYRAKNSNTGQYHYIMAAGRSMQNVNGKLYAYTSIVDITEQKNSQKLQEELAAEKKANKAKSQFLSNMSHEIRTPMNAIIGMTKLAEDEVEEDSRVGKYLSEIDESSQYLLDVINDILDMSRIDNGKLTLERQWVRPGAVIKACIDMVEPLMEKKGITLSYAPGIVKNHEYEYYVDEQKTKQVFMNILNNAYKFTDKGGHVSICAKNCSIDKEKHRAVDKIIIEDDGCGMSREFLKRIFKPFEQERIAHVGAVQGTGLGLSLAKHIVDLMGGDIKVESELGKGSRFLISFPYEYRYVREMDQVKAKEQKRPDLKGKNILVVEDHPLNAAIVTKILEKEGMKVTRASDGLEAVEFFEESEVGTFDAILMDIRMPKMNGIDAAKTIRRLERADAATIPILALTANAFDEDRKLTKEAGMNAHLSKPIDPGEMFYEIDRCIKKAVDIRIKNS